MIRPRLIHPRPVLLYKRIATEIDPELGPTGNIEWDEPITIPGQVKYNRYDQLVPTGGGDDPSGEGHVVFLESTWTVCGGQVGDEMELSPSTSRLVVLEVRPAAHYHG
ncbi:MAG: hypothetical protein LBT23_08265, partial [Synergistaceae bacterium]|nr:hypothetical protein [Synergistaceae bacterium]